MMHSSAFPQLTAAPSTAAASPLTSLKDRGTGHRLGAWDYAGMLAGFLFLLTITVVNSRGRIFWEDEMLGWLLLRDPSWHHMIRAWNLGADGGGFSFYLLGRAWFAIFGATPLTFRLFSGACFGIGFVAMWAALRRFFPVGIVAFATANTFFFSPPLTMHYIEGRFYGLLVMSTVLALWLALRLEDAPDRTPPRLLLAAFALHGLLTTSHVLGVVYSFFVLCGILAMDIVRGRRRWPLYLAIAASWLLLLPEIASIAAAGRVGKPHFWTHPPTALDVLGTYTGSSTEMLIVLTCLLAGAVLALSLRPGGLLRAVRDSYREHRPFFLVMLSVLLVPVWFLLEGLVGTWLFNSRYLQPVTVALALPTAELAYRALELPVLVRARRRWPGASVLATVSGGVAFVLFMAVWVFHHVAQATPEAVDFTDQLTSRLPHTLPVVVDDAFTFTGLISRQAHSGVQYTFLLDWPFSISAAAPWLEVTQFHLMENWKLAGYFPDHIQDAAEFLRDHPRFLVVHSGPPAPTPKDPKPEIGNPLAERLAHAPGYEVRTVFTLDRLDRDRARETVDLVCRGGCEAQAAQPPARCVMTARVTACCTGIACKLPEAEPPRRFWHLHSW